MLKNKYRSRKETETYLKDLKNWMDSELENKTEEMSDFFDKRIDIYEDVHLKNWQNEYEYIAEYFDSDLTNLLDIGCGTGLELKSMFKKYPDLSVTGIDLSEKMLKKLSENFKDKNINIIQNDYTKYPFPIKNFDAALAFETLHHFEYQTKQVIYDNIYNTLKKGGYLVECDYIACSEEEENLCLEYYNYKRNRDKIPKNTFIHIDIPLTIDHEITLMKNSGFEKIEILYENEGTMIIKAIK